MSLLIIISLLSVFPALVYAGLGPDFMNIPGYLFCNLCDIIGKYYIRYIHWLRYVFIFAHI